MQTSANNYLLFLACSDFLVILTGLFIFWLDSARYFCQYSSSLTEKMIQLALMNFFNLHNSLISWIKPPVLSRKIFISRSYIPSLAHVPYMTVYALPFGYMAQTCSIYFTVAAAIDCYVQVRLLHSVYKAISTLYSMNHSWFSHSFFVYPTINSHRIRDILKISFFIDFNNRLIRIHIFSKLYAFQMYLISFSFRFKIFVLNRDWKWNFGNFQVSWEEIRDNYCTVKKAMEINICITLCSIIYNSLRFPQFNLRKCFHDATQVDVLK